MTGPSESAGSSAGDPATRRLADGTDGMPAPSTAHLRLRAELMEAVRQALRRRRLRQRDAAALFGVAQPRVSDLVRGKVALFSIDTLVDMLAATGVTVELKLRAARTVTDESMPRSAMTPRDKPVRRRHNRDTDPGASR